MTIRRNTNGRYYCGGRGCGSPLAYYQCAPEEGAGGEIACPDCDESIFVIASPPSSPLKDKPTVSTSISKSEPQNEAESKTSIEREKP